MARESTQAAQSEVTELTRVLEELQNAESFQAAAQCLTRWARAFSGCQAAVLRLLPDDGSPWLGICALDGPSPDFVRDEVLLHTRECICGRVATGAVRSALPFYTESGSFVWNKLSQLSEHFTSDEVGNLRGRCLKEGYESLAVVPVKTRGKPIGSLHLADTRPGVFDNRLAVVEAACRLAGTELVRHRSEERNRVLLQTVGSALLPTVPPSVAGLEMGVAVVSATDLARAGGDFYDVYDLGSLGVLIVVGDVSGRGLEALGIATQARYTLQAQVRADGDPASLLTRANKILLDILPPRRYVTAAACLLVRGSQEVVTCLAGHPTPLVVGGQGWSEVQAPTNPPLGLFPGQAFSQDRCTLHPGEVLLLYTDGVIEARRHNNTFGAQGAASVAQALVDHPPQHIAESVCQAATKFHDRHLPSDDRLVLSLRLA